MELMKQQVEQEKIRRRAKPFTASLPFTRQTAALESSRFAECPVKVCILYAIFIYTMSPKRSTPQMVCSKLIIFKQNAMKLG